MKKGIRIGILVVLALALALFVASFFSSSDDTLRVSFLDVGQGDATFIETPSGAQYVIDGGDGRGILRSIATVMPFYDRSIDGIIGTHYDRDHIGGLPYLYERFAISYAFDHGFTNTSRTYQAYRSAIEQEPEVTHTPLAAGDRYVLDEGVILEVLHPSERFAESEHNDRSLVLRLVYGKYSFLLPGDISQEIEKYLIAQYSQETLASTVLKVAHHGSSTSSAMDFLSVVQPAYAVLSYGCENSYGHPSSEVLDRLVAITEEIYHTCTDGTIDFQVENDQLRIQKISREGEIF